MQSTLVWTSESGIDSGSISLNVWTMIWAEMDADYSADAARITA